MIPHSTAILRETSGSPSHYSIPSIPISPPWEVKVFDSLPFLSRVTYAFSRKCLHSFSALKLSDSVDPPVVLFQLKCPWRSTKGFLLFIPLGDQIDVRSG